MSDPLDMERLYKLMALFDAELEGERSAALAAANRMIAAAGTTWRALIDRSAPKQAPRAAPQRAVPDPECDCEECCRATAALVAACDGFGSLAERHQNFIQDIIARDIDRPLSDKQKAYVFGLADKLGMRRQRAA